ncbi:hypothetical protein RFI_26831, partial [Reticulomyxa filosa]
SRALVPVGFPDKREFAHQKDWLRNDFSFVSWLDTFFFFFLSPSPSPLSLFLSDITSLRIIKKKKKADSDRLKTSNKQANALKQSMQPLLLSLPTQLAVRLGFFDTLIEKTVTDSFVRHSCVFSNVPGFNEPVYFGGAPVERLEASYFNTIPQVILMSFNGFVDGTLVVDPEKFPKPDLIVDGIFREVVQEYLKLNKEDKRAQDLFSLFNQSQQK